MTDPRVNEIWPEARGKIKTRIRDNLFQAVINLKGNQEYKNKENYVKYYLLYKPQAPKLPVLPNNPSINADVIRIATSLLETQQTIETVDNRLTELYNVLFVEATAPRPPAPSPAELPRRQPVPRPAPEPAPQPRQQPAPRPAPQPAPQPRPAPQPAPQPAPVPHQPIPSLPPVSLPQIQRPAPYVLTPPTWFTLLGPEDQARTYEFIRNSGVLSLSQIRPMQTTVTASAAAQTVVWVVKVDTPFMIAQQLQQAVTDQRMNRYIYDILISRNPTKEAIIARLSTPWANEALEWVIL